MLRSCLLLVTTAAPFALAHAAALQFDKPLRTEIVQTGPKTTLHCLSYPRFMLKWEGDGRSAEYRAALIGKKSPGCNRETKGEWSLGHWDLARVKGGFLFLNQTPNPSSGLYFKVIDTRGAWRTAFRDMVVGDFTSVRLQADGIVLQYRREYYPDCSLYYGVATECWGKTKAATGLTDALMPRCRESYEEQKIERDVADITGYPATVTYNVEARFANGRRSYLPRRGSVACTV